jgi:hypothetical protein
VIAAIRDMVDVVCKGGARLAKCLDALPRTARQNSFAVLPGGKTIVTRVMKFCQTISLTGMVILLT